MKTANKTNRHLKGGETAVGGRLNVKVLLYDVESSPNIGYCWGKWEQNIIEFVTERQVISVAWKWLGDEDVHVLALPSFPGYKRNRDDNRHLMMALHKLISEADVAIGHNVDEFDDKMINTDFIKHGLTPPPPHKSIDTLKVAKRYFRFNSNKLDDLGAFLKVGKKVKHWGFELWKRCLAGDMKAWRLMMKYNKGDVVLLEKIYLKLRPWMVTHPDFNAIDGHSGCPACKSVKLIRRGWAIVGAGRKQRYQCGECGRWCKGKLQKHGSWKFA